MNGILSGCFITGIDTDVGKTVVTASLLSALQRLGADAIAIKPVQTGCEKNGNNWLAPDVQTYMDALADNPTASSCCMALNCFEPACSPHLAAYKAGINMNACELARKIREAAKGRQFCLVEGAGGIMAPLNEQETMLDLMLVLRLPLLLVAPNRLGCISHVLSSLRIFAESSLSGIGIILCRLNSGDDELHEENRSFIARRAKAYGFPLLAELPYLANLNVKQQEHRHKALQELAEILTPTAQKLLAGPIREQSGQKTVAQLDKFHIWHPYAGTDPAPHTLEVAGARGARIELADGTWLLDGMSSWWCANLGYGRMDLLNALLHQGKNLAHIMFGGFTHAPAVNLAQKLLDIAPGAFERVFFADSGSVAVEVALKMAIQYQLAKGRHNKLRICAFRGAYHGDTLGAMSVCDPVNGMHSIFGNCIPKQFFLDRPVSRFCDQPDESALVKMEDDLRQHADEIAAVIVEPIVQGAGGMWFYHPAWLYHLRILCDKLDILLVADEIATGFGRTGKLFACEWAGISPDIICIGKALTGGFMSFAATVATENVAKTVSRPDAAGQPGVLLHGPTFMANPLACSVALQAINTLLGFPWQENVKRIENELRHGLEPCCGIPGIKDVRILGAIGVVETEKKVNCQSLQDFFVKNGVWIRPFNNLIYVMPPFIATNAEVQKLTSVISKACRQNKFL